MPRRREGPVLNKQTGYFFFDSYVGFAPNRHRVRFSLHTTDRARAQLLWEREYKRIWAEYYGVKPAERLAPPTVEKAFEDFLAFKRDIRRVEQPSVVKTRLAVMARFIGRDKLLSDVGDAEVAAVDAGLKKMGRALATINHYMKLFKECFKWAIDEKRHPGPNPLRSVRPYIVKKRRREYSPAEIAKILEAAKEIEAEARPQDGIMRRAYRIVRLLALTGMRDGELLNLKWESVKDDMIVLANTATKQRKENIVPITSTIRGILDSLAAERKDDYILPLRRKGGRMEASYCYGLIERVREKTGIEDFILHGLRHRAITVMIAEALGRGAGLIDIMRIVGHSQMQTTLGYQHADVERMIKALEILDANTPSSPSKS